MAASGGPACFARGKAAVKQISLTGIKLNNFRSFIGSTTIDLTTGAGLKLISGDNRAEPRLGANGAGKSTLWDAVCFVLYGTSVRGLRSSDLVSYGKLNTSAQLSLAIDGAATTIQRSAPPNRLFIGGEQVDQQAVEELVGLTKARFLNSVIFGQAVPLFIDLPVPARGDLLDEVLDLEMWMQAADLATQRHKAATQSLTVVREAIQRTLGQQEGLGDFERFRELEEAWQAQKTARFEELMERFEEMETQHAALAQALATPLVLLDERRLSQEASLARTRNTEAISKKSALDVEMSMIEANILFFQENETCPTCEQPIDASHVEAFADRVTPRVEELDKLIANASLDIETTAGTAHAADATWRAAIFTNQQHRNDLAVLTAKVESLERELGRMEQEAVRLSEEASPYEAQAQEAVAEYQRLEGVLELQKIDEQHALTAQQSFDFWRQGFRRVRLYCLERVLEELSLETRNSLLALGLPEWGIVFKTATETRSGTVKLGVQIDVSSPDAQSKFDMMSGGESQRARLAVSLGLANLIQRWAGVRFDFEVFDEPTAWLSEQGVEDLLESLRARAEAGNRSIWICDHRALAHSGFVEQLCVIKDEAGSRLSNSQAEA
jgi:DNA repair exonuclease SbcCD ATPase subunit